MHLGRSHFRHLMLCVALPAVQLLAAIFIFIHAEHAYPPYKLDTLWIPTSKLICIGINAPAVILEMLPLFFWPYFQGRVSHLIPLAPSSILFLVGVACLWYLIGRRIEAGKVISPVNWRNIAAVVIRLVLILWGVFLIMSGVLGFEDPEKYNNRTGNLAEATCVILWGLILIIVLTADLISKKSPEKTLPQHSDT